MRGGAYMDEDHLVRKIRAGDELAAAMVVSLFGGQLAGYARAIAGDLSDADREVISETAVEKAVRKIDLFDRNKGTLFGWLRAFLRTEVAGWRRSMERMEPLSGEEEEKHQDSDSVPAARLEAAKELVALLASLRDTDQLILSLRDLEGLSYREISVRLNVPEDTCRQRHLRAAARLRERAMSVPTLVNFLKGGRE
jgi:RNA polymerase sigma factor (sigma-70 family)